jgi:cyclomaltodextrinase / maltogenic alpha-amylase / neopullulanase
MENLAELHSFEKQRTVPSWVQHAIWWHVYPLGFLGAETIAEARSECHRIGRLVDWLDYLVELGASGILLGPIFSSFTHGYDTVDYFEIDPRLGNYADFLRLLKAAQDRGLRVILDGVFNHVSSRFPIFRRALDAGGDTSESRWFRRKLSADNFGLEAGYENFEGHPNLIALNHADPEVAAFVIRVMCHWLSTGIDGWRLDAAYAVPTEFWAEVLHRVRSIYPQAYFVGEVIHGDYTSIVKRGGLDSVTQYEVWKAIWSSINDRNFFELAWALKRHNACLDSFVPLTFVGNHDVSRIASQIQDARHLDHALVILLTIGGTPSIYYGDEQAFRGTKEHRVGGDDAIRPAFPEEGRAALAPDGWPIYRLHQQLIGLRRRNAWLYGAKTQVIQLGNAQFAYQSGWQNQRIVVALNMDDKPMTFSFSGVNNLLLGVGTIEHDSHVVIPPHRWAVFA